MSFDPQELLQGLFHSAVEAADPDKVLPDHLKKLFANPPIDPEGKVVVVGAGKAAASMAAALEKYWVRADRDLSLLQGLVVTAYGHVVPCKQIEVLEAAHPIPDKHSEIAAERILKMVSGLKEGDRVIFLVSGGGSSLLALPARGISLVDKQRINQALLKSGADIHEINCVRKHLSAIKGGRLAAACAPASLVTLAISDVSGDDPAVIGSGPSVPDPSTREQAAAVLQKYQIAMGDGVRRWLASPDSETPKPGGERFADGLLGYQLVATARQSLLAAAMAAEKQGVKAYILGDDLTGESQQLAAAHTDLVHQILEHGQPVRPPCVLLSGGETTVTVSGRGRGGRNTEYVLSMAAQLEGQPGVYVLAADTDGIDGSGDNAGAIHSPDDWGRAKSMGLNTLAMLKDNDSYHYFEALNDLVFTGPTRTNVNDFRAILVLPVL